MMLAKLHWSTVVKQEIILQNVLAWAQNLFCDSWKPKLEGNLVGSTQESYGLQPGPALRNMAAWHVYN